MRRTAILLLMLAVPFRAWAGLLPAEGVSAPEVASALKAEGYPALAGLDPMGEPTIRSSTGKQSFNIDFFQCGQALRCASVRFVAPFHKALTPAVMAAWNREHGFGRVWLDGAGMAWLAMDVETGPGMTSRALEANILRWIEAMTRFDTFPERSAGPER